MDQVQQYASPEMPDRDNPPLLTSAITASTITSALSYKMVPVLFITPVKS